MWICFIFVIRFFFKFNNLIFSVAAVAFFEKLITLNDLKNTAEESRGTILKCLLPFLAYEYGPQFVRDLWKRSNCKWEQFVVNGNVNEFVEENVSELAHCHCSSLRIFIFFSNQHYFFLLFFSIFCAFGFNFKNFCNQFSSLFISKNFVSQLLEWIHILIFIVDLNWIHLNNSKKKKSIETIKSYTIFYFLSNRNWNLLKIQEKRCRQLVMKYQMTDLKKESINWFAVMIFQ